MKNIFIICFLLYSVSFYAFAQSTSSQVRILPAQLDVISQSEISFNIEVFNISQLHAASVTIEYENFFVDYNSITNGNFLQNNSGGYGVARFITLLPNSSNPTSVKIDLAILGPAASSGSGILFGIKFIPLNAGDCSLNIIDLSLKDNNNDPLTADVFSSNLNIFANLNAKVFLQGPFNGSNMDNTLNSDSFLPSSQPYNTLPWSYAGNETVTRSFFTTNPTIVDWLLIELRDKRNSSTVIYQKCVFLNNDGELLNLSGTDGLQLDIEADEYYLVIHHRNHLSIMSAQPIMMSYNSTFYDFTNDQLKAFGSNPMINLGNGMYGMPAGDANGNGQIQNNDKEIYWKLQIGQAGYKNSDFNMNGQVQNNDKEIYWKTNIGKGTQVP